MADEKNNIFPEGNENQEEIPTTDLQPEEIQEPQDVQEDFEFLGDPAKQQTAKKSSGKLSKLMPIIVLGVIAALLLGAFGILSYLNKEDNPDDETKAETIQLFNFTGTSAQRLEIENQVDKFAFVRKLEKTYYIEGHEDCAINNSTVLSMLTTFGGLTAVTEVATDVTDFEEYGLKKPISTATWIKNDTKHTLEIGDIAPSGNYYIRIDGQSTVYTLSADLAALFCSPRMDFYNPNIYDFNQETDANYINYFEIERRGEDVIKIELTDLSQEDIDSAYKLIAPIKHNVGIEKSNEFTDIVANMSSLTVYSDDVTDKGLEQFGLLDPAIKFTFVNVATEYKFRISEVNDKGYAFVYKEGGTFVYIVDKSTIEILKYKLADYCESMSYPRSYDTISSLVITGGSKRYEIAITGTAAEDSLKAYINDKYVEYENFSELYGHIIGIEIKDVRKVSVSGQPLVTIKINCTDKTVDTLEYYKLSDLESCFVLNGGEKQIIVSTAKVEQILEFSQKLFDGEEIVTEW